jgi:hypothetical protein
MSVGSLSKRRDADTPVNLPDWELEIRKAVRFMRTELTA